MNYVFLAAALAASISLTCSSLAAAEPSTSIVQTSLGKAEGIETAKVRVFMGLPYARPPVGEFRWAPPQDAASWNGIRDAKAPPPACPQNVAPGFANPSSRFSEDCLYLNVTAPATGEKMPVIVWLHGGGFNNGEGRDYGANKLAEDGKVVVVTVNYRLGVFGFAAFKGVDGSGVFGLLDQQAALKWVAENAAAFGGDPNNITLMGQSAGAMSVCAQMVSPAAEGLFHKAILQSGSCIQRWPAGLYYPGLGALDQFVTLNEVEAFTGYMLADTGCTVDDIECLRRVPAEKLVKPWLLSRAAYGTPTLPVAPGKALRDGTAHAVPVMWGSARDEWRTSAGAYALTRPMTVEIYEESLGTAFGDRAKEVLARYPVETFGSPAYAWSAVSTDVAWSCPALESVKLAGKKAPAFFYEFADRKAPNPAYQVPEGYEIGAAHATELPYLFDIAGTTAALSPEQQTLAAQMRAYWTNFAWRGDPSADGLPAWPAVKGKTETHALAFAPEGVAMDDFSSRHRCDLWQTFADTF